MDEQKKPSDVSAFFQEILERLKQRSPKFFHVLSRINMLILALSGVPTILNQLNIVIPPHWAILVLKITTAASAWGLFIGKLTVQGHPEIVQTDNGVLLTKPSPDLPFTEKKELTKVVEIKNDEQK
jgi:hypothetical protein